MAFRDSRPIAFIIYSGFLVFLADARAWDLAVTIGKEVHFFANNGTMTGRVKAPEAVQLSGIAYDDSSRTIFLSDTQNQSLTILLKDLEIKNGTIHRLYKSPERTHIVGLAYDTETQNLFWSDTTGEAIARVNVPAQRSGSGEPDVLLNLPSKSPRGISLDACNRRLYWANSNTKNASIESSKLDGSDRITVINQNLYEPMGVAVDHWSAKLYWIDDEEGVYYKIERSNLDGTNRELLVHGRHQMPYNLAVDREYVYWSDWAMPGIYRTKKDAKPGERYVRWVSFLDSNRDSDPKSIVARDNIGNVDCAAMRAAEEENSKAVDSATKDEESENNLITSTEVVGDSVDSEDSGRCLNGATHDTTVDICRCKPGFDGPFCERSMCHNYCLHGECYVTAGGQPRCKCSPSYQGPRCESNICDGHCLNDGHCSIKNSEPFCTCKSSFGSRCENTYDMKQVCAIFCASKISELSGIDTSSCSCRQGNETAALTSAYDEDLWCKSLIIAFSTLLAILTTVVAVLSYYVNKLRRRPRIKKRFVVSKTGITPLTARPQLPSDQCEIMIENCCNMNICETPCFEPKLRSGDQHVHKKDEKNSLLDNMDGNSC